MGPEIVTVVAGGRRWTAFESVEVTASYKEAARSFKIEIAAESGGAAAAWTFQAGTAIEIYFNADLVCRGYVDRYQPQISEHDQAKATVSGRSRAQDFIDAAAVHKTGQFKNMTPAEIAQALDSGGVGVTTNRTLAKEKSYRLTPGETRFRCVEKLCRKQGMTLTGRADGSILITDGLQGMHAGALIEGVNLKAGEADHNWAGRHSKVIVRGQRAIGHGADALEIEAEAADGAVPRDRPVIVIEDGDIDKQTAKRRARHRRDREAGEALKATCTVQGFRDDGGRVWEPGFGLFTQSPFLAIAQVMLVGRAVFKQARSGGSVTQLSLVDPRAYAGKAGKGGKSGGAWGTDAGKELPYPENAL